MAYKNVYFPYSEWEKQQYKEKYHEYLESDEWQQIRTKVLERDGYRCRHCGYVYDIWAMRQLHVHHLTYDRIFHEWLEDLITLCEDCHRDEHKGDCN